jgi:hypothetical protein
MTVVVQGCWILNPEISFGHTVIPPPGKGKPVGISIKNRSKQKNACRRFFVTFSFLDSFLRRVKASSPSQTAPPKMSGLGGFDWGPRVLILPASVKLEFCFGGSPLRWDCQKKCLGL